MQQFIDFFNHPFFIIVGGISTLVMIVTFFYAAYVVISGVLPVWVRLGYSLSKKKIGLFAEQDFASLKGLLVDSGIFKEKNIEQITVDSIAKGEKHTMMLVNYVEFKDKVEEIIKYKKDSDALIVYSPHSAGPIKPELMSKINEQRNSIVVNLRGRLLNDILISMITTIYGKG